MNKINQLFANNKDRKLLSLYFCAGHPTLEGTVQVIKTLADKGIDMIEIGIPFSDPMADGPVIQDAATKALRNGMTLKKLFGQLENIRQENVEIPLILMGYLNPIMQYGFEEFCKSCVNCGIDGVIVPDLPYEEYDEINGTAEQYGIIPISLVTPVSFERTGKIASQAKGFLYCVSSTGVTGVRDNLNTNLSGFFDTVKEYSKVPNMLGFGISKPEQAREIRKYADGIIVGSAIVRLIDEEDRAGSTAKIAELTASLRAALDE